MNVKFVLKFIFLLGFLGNTYAQINSHFQQGFNQGYEETLRDANITGKYPEYADSRKCNSKLPYQNDKNANQKLYADGYRCGVNQATIAILKIQKSNVNNGEEKLNISNSEVGYHADAIRNYQKIAELEKSENKPSQENVVDNEVANTVYNNQDIAYSHAIQMQKHQQAQQQYYQRIEQGISNAANSLEAGLRQAQEYRNNMELQHRIRSANQFISSHNTKARNLLEFYNKIPKQSFSRPVTGLFEANIFTSQSYTFSQSNIITVIPCLVNVVENKLINIYPYGKSGFELDYPEQFPEQSYFSQGFVEYQDYSKLQNITILLMEPYFSTPKKHTIDNANTGFVSLWTSRKENEGKIVYIQELNSRNEIVRETKVSLKYFKNEKEFSSSDLEKIPVNTGNDLRFMGEIKSTPFGNWSLYQKVSRSDMKPLKNNEERVVLIKNYL